MVRSVAPPFFCLGVGVAAVGRVPAVTHGGVTAMIVCVTGLDQTDQVEGLGGSTGRVARRVPGLPPPDC